jgi:hypothetical protein
MSIGLCGNIYNLEGSMKKTILLWVFIVAAFSLLSSGTVFLSAQDKAGSGCTDAGSLLKAVPDQREMEKEAEAFKLLQVLEIRDVEALKAARDNADTAREATPPDLDTPGCVPNALVQNFDGVAAPALPAQWATETIIPGTGVPPVWTTNAGGFTPSAAPVSSPNILSFNSFDCDAGAKALAYELSPMDFSQYAAAQLQFKIFQYWDGGIFSSTSEGVLVYSSLNGILFSLQSGLISNADPALPAGTGHWVSRTVDLSSLRHEPTVYIAFLGVSQFGYNIHLDDVSATGSCCPAITVANPAVETGTAGTAFSQIFTQTGGIAPVTFSTASALPAGLALASDGALSGTPTATGTFPITVMATDANGCTGTGTTYNLVIECQAITVTAPAADTGIQNVPFSQTFTQTGGIAPVTFSTVSAMPTGLMLASGGTLSGTPTGYGTFPITVTATDANGCTGSRLYTLVILQTPGAPAITAITDDNPCVQSGISITFTAGSPATRHDLYRDGGLIISGVSSPIGYDPGGTSSRSYVVRAVNTDDACHTDSLAYDFSDQAGGPSQPVITGITDISSLNFGLKVYYTPGSPADRHDLYKDGVLVYPNFPSGGTYTGGDATQHSYTVASVSGPCQSFSPPVTATDQGPVIRPRPKIPLEPLPLPKD